MYSNFGDRKIGADIYEIRQIFKSIKINKTPYRCK